MLGDSPNLRADLLPSTGRLFQRKAPLIPSIANVTHALREGYDVFDYEFDVHLEPETRSASTCFWTPLDVARRTAELLEARGVKRVLDVGSGAGKFCVVGALTSTLQFTGIEQRGHLVRAANHLARRFKVDDRVSFEEGTLARFDASTFDALYFFNPFAESKFAEEDRYDDFIELGEQKFQRDVWFAEQLLAGLPVGTLVATYHGFGGYLPGCYEPAHIEEAGSSFLRMWKKVTEHDKKLPWQSENDDHARNWMRMNLLHAPDSGVVNTQAQEDL